MLDHSPSAYVKQFLLLISDTATVVVGLALWWTAQGQQIDGTRMVLLLGLGTTTLMVFLGGGAYAVLTQDQPSTLVPGVGWHADLRRRIPGKPP